MFYKPNFCCECGEKIERSEWGMLTSRRFCQTCETDFTKQEVIFNLSFFLLGCLVIFFIFKIATPINEESNPVKTEKSEKNGGIVKKEPTNNEKVSSKSKNLITNSLVDKEKQTSIKEQVEVSPTPKQSIEVQSPVTVSEKSYFCGAVTKKGTPCSRKVKGAVRCWQHRGQKALLPPEKLIASQ